MSSKRQGCQCDECVECCTREAGWFMPDELAGAAHYLGLSQAVFVKTYCRENIEGQSIILSPRSKSRSSECIFLGKDRSCQIHPVKPYECRKVFGCEGEGRHQRIRQVIRKRWESY